ALLVWVLGDASPAAEACFRPTGGPCGAVTTLQAGETHFPVAAIGTGGHAVAQWSQGLSPGVARARFRPTGGAFDDAVDLTSGLNVLVPHDAAAVDALGHAVIVVNSLSNDPPSTTTAFVNDSVPPAISSLAGPAGGSPGQLLAFGGEVSDVWGPVSSTWAFGDGATAAGPSAGHAYAAPGSFVASLAATDAAGNSATRSALVDVAAPDETPPRILSFGMTHTTFAVGRGRTPLSARRVPVGTRFRFRVSEAGSAAIAIQRKRGRRWKKVATLRRTARAGTNSVAFSGRLDKKALRAGGYRAVLTETDAAKNRSKPRRLGFRVVRR
ncbi:MAG TPA: PKD domain-containing protein, partial [Conexibacter sp.]|nr:PKD domain-containing protein [Conexibacter sp.]